MSEAMYWVHEMDPFLIRFPESFPLEGIRWYGIAYLAGFFCAGVLLVLYYRKGRSSMDADGRAALLTAVIIGALLGGRIGYMMFYDTLSFFKNPFIFFKVWEGGMASHGGFIGVTLGVYWHAWRYKVCFMRLGDIVVTLAPPGLFFGRIANFINGELWGRVTDAPWAVVFKEAQFPPYFDQEKFTVLSERFGRLVNPRHPSQLYEALLEGLLLMVLLQWRFWKFPKLPAGQLAGEFFIAYAVMRIICEVFREPDSSLILWMSRGTFYSLFMIAAGILIIRHARRSNTASG